jgi:hypothetical protein
MKNEFLLNALLMKLEGEAALHEANIRVYMENPVGIGEHPQIIEAIETEVSKLAEALEKIDTINANFYAKAERSEL